MAAWGDEGQELSIAKGNLLGVMNRLMILNVSQFHMCIHIKT